MRIWALGLSLGCTEDIRQAAATAPSTRGIVATHPADGAAALRGDVGVQVRFGPTDPTPTVRLTSPARDWTPDCDLLADGWLRCAPIQDLPRGQVFDLELSLGDPGAVMLSVDSHLPEDARAYRLRQMAVHHFGASPSAAALLTELLAHTTVLVVSAGPLQAGKRTLWLGLGEKQGSEHVLRPPGLTTVYDVDVKHHLAGTPQDIFLPVQVDTTVVPLLIEGCTIKAGVTSRRLERLALTGTIPAASLLQLTAPLGPLQDAALSRIALDVDTDGDGEPDAASIKVVSDAPRVTLRDY